MNADLHTPAPRGRLSRRRFALALPLLGALPGLAPACDPKTVLRWLAAAEPRLRDAASLHLELLAYRPLRRAGRSRW